tara:strand:+ start:4867 stop:6015 length:1149 start_codon:yes stop_codon:yes gene_type:complete
MVTTLSNNAILTRKQETLDAQALRRTVAMREIQIIDEKTISYNGKSIRITDSAFKSLMRNIGMSQTFIKKFEKLFNAKAKAQFINTMKNAMATNSGDMPSITMVLNPVNKVIVAFAKDASELISNSNFVEQAERVLNSSDFGVANWTTDPTTGIVTLNAVKNGSEFAVAGDKKDVFTAGITMKNSPITGFQVSPYVNRLWCANGLTTSLAEDKYNMTNLSEKSLTQFNEYMQDLTRRDFVPSQFNELVTKARNTHASLSELSFATNAIEKAGAGERAAGWIPLNENISAYESAGINTKNFNNSEMKNAKSDQSIWSVVNSMTHFASHGENLIDGVEPHRATDLMVRAGNLLGKGTKGNWDLGNQVRSPFTSLSENQHGEILN